MRRAIALAVAFVVMIAVGFLPLGPTGLSGNGPGSAARAQTPGYEYAVLPGIQSSVDTYLYLRQGSSRTGDCSGAADDDDCLADDDDSGPGYDSRIEIQVDAGTYTVEATTHDPATTNYFSLTISNSTSTPPVLLSSSGDCGETVTLPAGALRVDGAWTGDCISSVRPGSYARYYTFSLATAAKITINLTSSPDGKNATGLTLTCGWHYICQDDRDSLSRQRGIDMRASAGEPVYAAFRTVDGGKLLVADIDYVTNSFCKKVQIDLLIDGDASKSVGILRYTHTVVPSVTSDEPGIFNLVGMVISRDAQAVTLREIGQVARVPKTGESGPEFDNPAVHPTNPALKCPLDGSHLHQEGEYDGYAALFRNLGFPKRTDRVDGSGCFSSGTWILKIASEPPEVTATETPTATCPPTRLQLSETAPEDLQLSFTTLNSVTVKAEVYQSPSRDGFCHPDDDAQCAPAATGQATRSGALTIPFEGLTPESWYRTRGRGCIPDPVDSSRLTCGSWSGFSQPLALAVPEGSTLEPRKLSLRATTLDEPTSLELDFTLHSDAPSDLEVEAELYGPTPMTHFFCDPDTSVACMPHSTARTAQAGVTSLSLDRSRGAAGWFRARARGCIPDPVDQLTLLCDSWGEYSDAFYVPDEALEQDLPDAWSDLVLNAAEVGSSHELGFTFWEITGTAGSRGRSTAGTTLRVTLGGSELAAVEIGGEGNEWSVTVGADVLAALADGPHMLLAEVVRGGRVVKSRRTPIRVDVTAPSVTYERENVPNEMRVGEAVSISPTTSDLDIDTYAIKAGSSLPAGLSLNTTSGVISESPSTAGAARTVTIVVTDDAGNTADVTLTLPAVLAASDTAPSFPQPTASYNFEWGESVSETLPAASGGNGPLSYSLSGEPSWLTFDVTTRRIGGTAPNSNASESMTLTVGDSDANTSGADEDALAVLLTVGQPTCTLTVTAGTGGTAGGSGTFPCNTSQAASATANSDYQFSNWSGDSTSTSSSISVLLDGDKSVHASFRMCTLAVTAGTGGSAGGSGTFPCNTSQAASATANSDYQFSNWSGDSTSTSSSISVYLDGDKSVHANFRMCTLTVTAGPGGTASGSGTFPCNTSQGASATANSDYQFSNWSGDSTSTSSSISVYLDDDKSVHANFRMCTLTVTAGTGGTASGGGTYPCNTSASASATAHSGYQFGNWSGDSTSTSSSISVSLSGSDKSVHANFAEIMCTLTVTAGTGGTASGDGTFPCNTWQPASATANSGYEFSNWSGDSASRSSSIRIYLSGDKSVHANFAEIMCTLTVTAGTGGTASGDGTFPCNTSQIASATVSIGYFFDGWSGDSTSSSRTISVYLDGDKSVHANFSPRDQYTLTTSVRPPYGTINVSPSGPYFEGYDTIVTVTVSPWYPSYYFSHWEGDCSGTHCSLTMNGNKSVTAVLEEDCDPNIGCTRTRGEGEPYTLTLTVNGAGIVTTSGPPTLPPPGAAFDVTLTASWSDATHEFAGWGGDCSGPASTCVLTIDGDKSVTADITELPADRCTEPADADCIRAVYRGAPGDYAQVTDIPLSALVAPTSDGGYEVGGGVQITVVTAAPLREGHERFHLGWSPAVAPSPVSEERLVLPVGTTYTFTSATDAADGTVVTFELTAGSAPEEGEEPEPGQVVVRTTFRVTEPPAPE